MKIIEFDLEFGFELLAKVAGRMENHCFLEHTASVHSILKWPATGDIQDLLLIAA